MKSTNESSIQTIVLEEEGEVSLSDFTNWLAQILWEQKSIKIYRCKGIVAISSEDEKFVLQGVSALFDCQTSGVKWESNVRKSKLLFIGKNISQKDLSNSFQSILIRKKY